MLGLVTVCYIWLRQVRPVVLRCGSTPYDKAGIARHGKMSHPNRNKVHDWPEFIKRFRADHGLSQKELANKLQISLRNIENWEGGLSHPPAYLKKALQSIIKE